MSFPREAPEIRSIAVAEEKPTSARLKVRDLDEVCQLMMTEVQGLQYEIETSGNGLPATVDPSARGPAHTSWSFVYLRLNTIDFPNESCCESCEKIALR